MKYLLYYLKNDFSEIIVSFHIAVPEGGFIVVQEFAFKIFTEKIKHVYLWNGV